MAQVKVLKISLVVKHLVHQAQASPFVNLGPSLTGSGSSDAIVGTTIKSPPFTFNHRDTILYNLGGKSSLIHPLKKHMHSLFVEHVYWSLALTMQGYRYVYLIVGILFMYNEMCL